MSEETILVAREAFDVTQDGIPVQVRRGETFRVGHPLIDGREELFKPFGVDNEWDESMRPAKAPRKAAGRR